MRSNNLTQSCIWGNILFLNNVKSEIYNPDRVVEVEVQFKWEKPGNATLMYIYVTNVSTKDTLSLQESMRVNDLRMTLKIYPCEAALF